MTHILRSLLTFCLSVAMAYAPPPAEARGYEARACGFDFGTSASTDRSPDCELCRGDTRTVNSAGTIFDQRYVACGEGSDQAIGTAEAPFATITRALREVPDSGTSLAVCFHGRCAPSNGEQFPLVPRSGQEMPSNRDGFDYPGAPAVLSGWDRDRDGVYPPMDGEAVLDGEGITPWAIANTRPASDLEIAHFSARSFGAGDGGGFMAISSGGPAERNLPARSRAGANQCRHPADGPNHHLQLLRRKGSP